MAPCATCYINARPSSATPIAGLPTHVPGMTPAVVPSPRPVTHGRQTKVPRRRVLKEGKIVYADGLRMLDCTIRDISDQGAPC